MLEMEKVICTGAGGCVGCIYSCCGYYGVVMCRHRSTRFLRWVLGLVFGVWRVMVAIVVLVVDWMDSLVGLF